MCPSIEITNDVYSRLEKHVIGFDTPSSVIGRLLDSFEMQNNSENSNMSLSHEQASSHNHRLYTNKEIQQKITLIANSLPEEELENLCKESISKEIFEISFPLFIKVKSTENQATKKQAVKSNDGVNRWTWKFEFVRNGYSYAVCTQWYPKHDRLVQKWLKSHS